MQKVNKGVSSVTKESQSVSQLYFLLYHFMANVMLFDDCEKQVGFIFISLLLELNLTNKIFNSIQLFFRVLNNNKTRVHFYTHIMNRIF